MRTEIHVPATALPIFFFKAMKGGENLQMGIAHMLQAILKGSTEIKGGQAVIEVVLYKLEQLFISPDIFLAIQDDFDHFLVHLQ